MLRVKCTRKLGQEAVSIDRSAVVIVEDEFGNPLVAVAYVGPQVCTIALASDPDFNKVLQGLGIDKIVVDEKVNYTMPLPQGNVKLLRGPTGFDI